MQNLAPHFDLIGVIMLSTLFGAVNTYGVYHRDWCGIRLWPSVLAQNFLPVACIVLIYFKIIRTIEIPFLERYHFPVYLTAAILAEIIAKRLLRPEAPPLKDVKHQNVPALPTVRRITRKKLTVADKIGAREDAGRILEDAIDTSDLPRASKAALKRKIDAPPSRGQIIQVINKVGLAHIKVLV